MTGYQKLEPSLGVLLMLNLWAGLLLFAALHGLTGR
jgi:hypothetical protein